MRRLSVCRLSVTDVLWLSGKFLDLTGKLFTLSLAGYGGSLLAKMSAIQCKVNILKFGMKQRKCHVYTFLTLKRFSVTFVTSIND